MRAKLRNTVRQLPLMVVTSNSFSSWTRITLWSRGLLLPLESVLASISCPVLEYGRGDIWVFYSCIPKVLSSL